MAAVLGVVCALLSPLFMVCGFLLWESQWKGDALELNIFKCSFASALFGAACAATSGGFDRLDSAGDDAKGFLVLSSVLGICLGDIAWLVALKAIGARRVILVDALGPPMAAVLAHFFLGERVGVVGYVGMVVTVVGVAVAALEREQGGDAAEDPKLARGYVLAVVNVTLDAVGSLLTKGFGGHPLNTFDIGLLRFGSAAAILGAVYAVRIAAFGCPKRQKAYEKLGSEEGDIELPAADEAPAEDPPTSGAAPVGTGEAAGGGTLDRKLLCMTRRQWLYTALAVSLVTFTCPSLKNFAMFQISLAATTTLTSIGPLYSIPLVVLTKGERVSWRSVAASFAAVGGVAMLVAGET